MTKLFSRNAVRVAGAALIALLSLALLVSCAPGEKEKTPAQLNREYMASVSENVEDLASELKVFSDAAGEQDIASMTLSAERATKIIDTIEALKAPDALADVHKAYVSGARELLGALNDYVDLYTQLQNGSIEGGEAQARLKAIQADYDKGISQLKEADGLAIEVAGISKDSADSGTAAGATADSGSTSDASAADAA